MNTEKAMTPPQRGKLFSEMKKIEGLDIDTLEESLGFGVSELSVSEASKLIDVFVSYHGGAEGNKTLQDAITDVKQMHGQQTLGGENHATKASPGATTPPKSTDEEKAAKKKDLMDRNGVYADGAKKKDGGQHPMSTDIVHIGDLELSLSQLQSLGNLPQYLNHIFKQIMQSGTDYGVIEGTARPTLFKAGAEILRLAFKLTYKTEVTGVENWDTGFFAYRVKTVFFDQSGREVGSGEGSCNNKETRYASRWVSASKLPADVDPKTLPSKKYRGTNGEYLKYRIDTDLDEKMTQANTILKMAKKRSFVDGILSITGASRIFTQDVEDLVIEGEVA